MPAADVWPGCAADSQRPAPRRDTRAATSVSDPVFPAPGAAGCQVIRLPYAQEWLTAAKCDDLLAFLKDFIDRICDIVRQDAQRIAAALVPSAAPRLMEKRFGDWRLVADEYGHDNWLDSEDGERLDQVLDGILARDARFCPVLLTLVNESREEIEAAGVMTDLLRFPGGTGPPLV